MSSDQPVNDQQQRQVNADLALLSTIADKLDSNQQEKVELLTERNRVIRRLFDAGVQQVVIARHARRSAMAVALALGGGPQNGKRAPRRKPKV